AERRCGAVPPEAAMWGRIAADDARRYATPMRSLAWLPLAALLLAIPRPGAAQDAMALFRQGRALAERGDWAGACPLFEESHRLQPDAIGILLNLADCQAHTGKLASAWSNYVE